jgi:hypothetical protein
MTTQIYPPLDLDFEKVHQQELNKEKSKNLFSKLQQLENEYKHYKKLKHKWNVFKNILHYSKYPVAGFMVVGDVVLLVIPTGVTQILGIAGIACTISEVSLGSIVEDTVVKHKVHKYRHKCEHLKEWIDKMYVFKSEAEHDGIISSEEIEKWRQLLEQYSNASKKLSNVQQDASSKTPQQPVDMNKLQEQILFLMTQLSKTTSQKTGT